MDNVHRFVRPTVYASPESNWSYTCNAPNVRGATIVLPLTLSGPCLDMLNTLTTNFCINLLGVCPISAVCVLCNQGCFSFASDAKEFGRTVWAPGFSRGLCAGGEAGRGGLCGRLPLPTPQGVD